jgi:hypothetical protein
MNFNKEVLLSSTLHDPRGVFLLTLDVAAEVVRDNYGGWIINVTSSTDSRVKDQIKGLEKKGIYFSETDTTNPIVADKVENDHMYLLGRTLTLTEDLEMRRVQYTNGDRMIMAAKYFPEDLQDMAKRAGEVGGTKSYLNFRRSAEDYFTHHPPLVETEFEFNRIYSQIFGMPIDIGGTSHVMSVDVLREVLSRSTVMEPVSFPHPKWLLIAKRMGANIDSAETRNVLTFETPEQFKDEISQTVENQDTTKVTLTDTGVYRARLKVEDLERAMD